MVRRIFQVRVRAAKCLMFLLAVGLSGCGGATGTLTGKVTAHSDPVAVGELVFEPIGENSQRQFYGQTDTGGMIVIDYGQLGGLPVGRYKITVTRFVLRKNGTPVPAGEKGETMKLDGRAVQQSFEFERDIVSGDNTINLELADGQRVEQR